MRKLIVLAGLPGTGKTTLARQLSARLSFFYLRVDCIEAPFAAVHTQAGAKGEGYEALINLAEENLLLGHQLMIDSVNPLHESRRMFRQLKDRMNADMIQFELKIKNSSLHQSRVENRKADLHTLKVPDWNDVLNRSYDQWDESVDGRRFIIWTDNADSALKSALAIINDCWGQLK